MIAWAEKPNLSISKFKTQKVYTNHFPDMCDLVGKRLTSYDIKCRLFKKTLYFIEIYKISKLKQSVTTRLYHSLKLACFPFLLETPLDI